jgi:hypothetical protein
MALEYDEKGKYFTDVIKKEVVLSQIQTSMHCIKGFVHIRIGERLSDAINRDTLFLPVTNAEVSSLEGEILYTSDFLAVNREQIVWLMPVEEHSDKPDE